MRLLTSKEHEMYAKLIFIYLCDNTKPIGYKKVSKIISYPIQHTQSNFREFIVNISETLNVIGMRIEEIRAILDKEVPFIQSLVINVTKKYCGDGFYKFKGYDSPKIQLDEEMKREITKEENKKCQGFKDWKLVKRIY